MEDRILKFVARYYKAGRLDIDRAFARFVNNAGIQMPGGGVPRLAGRRRTLFAMMPVAAALASFVTGMVRVPGDRCRSEMHSSGLLGSLPCTGFRAKIQEQEQCQDGQDVLWKSLFQCPQG